MDLKLQQRQARETGICPVREELYTQCFGKTIGLGMLPCSRVLDELIRQVTINCAERGLLLLRVRDEIRMTIAAYQTLYESSIAFGMRKALMAEQKKAELESSARLLEEQKIELENQLKDLEDRCDSIQIRDQERTAIDEKKHVEEVEFLKKTNEQLKSNLENLLSTPK